MGSPWNAGPPTRNWLRDNAIPASSDICVMWPFAVSGSNDLYPVIRDGKKVIKASHVVMEMDGRPRPDGAITLHSCDEPMCVNPHHLRWGTHKENAQDMVSKGRWAGKRAFK